MRFDVRVVFVVILIFTALSLFSQENNSFIEVICEPDVKVYLDNDFVGITNENENGLFIQKISAGNHSLRFEKENFLSQVEIITIEKGQVLSFRVKPFKPVENKILLGNADEVTGGLLIQSLPTEITVRIPSLDIDVKKTEDILEIESIKVGSYSASFSWKNKVLVHMIDIVPDKLVHVMVNMAALEISEVKVLELEESQKLKMNNLPDLEMVMVKGGVFDMGSSNGGEDEIPVHEVEMSDFYMSKYEITHAQFIKFLNGINISPDGSVNGITYCKINDGISPIVFEDGKFVFKATDFVPYETVPIINVTWYGARAFANWAGGELPTEAQWEYAAKGGILAKSTIYAGGDELEEVAEFGGNNYKHPMAVGGKMPNELGIHDLSGNVWEWCSDWYDRQTYWGKDRMDPQGPDKGEYKVNRGGSWACYARYCRTTNRYKNKPIDCFNYLGFRIVRKP